MKTKILTQQWLSQSALQQLIIHCLWLWSHEVMTGSTVVYVHNELCQCFHVGMCFTAHYPSAVKGFPLGQPAIYSISVITFFSFWVPSARDVEAMICYGAFRHNMTTAPLRYETNYFQWLETTSGWFNHRSCTRSTVCKVVKVKPSWTLTAVHCDEYPMCAEPSRKPSPNRVVSERDALKP